MYDATVDDERYIQHKGVTNMNIKAIWKLRNQIFDLDMYFEDKKISAENLVAFDGPSCDVVVRCAFNAPEFCGGVRLKGIRGHGDVVCRSSQVEAVRKEVLRNQRTRVKDILRLAVGERAGYYNVESMSEWAVNKFLDQYDQPLPCSSLCAKQRLNIPKADDFFEEDGNPRFMREGRGIIWPEDREQYR